MAIQFRSGSYAEKIVKNIALVGEYPYSSLYLMRDNDRMNKRNVLNLRKESYVTVNGNGGIKTIRLTRKSFPILKRINPQILEHYYSMSDNHHFRGAINHKNKGIWRKHRLAESYMMMQNLGASVWKFKKPALTLDYLSPEERIDSIDQPIYFDSVELKNIDLRQMYKVSFTRAVGLLLSLGGLYSVYNINKGLIKWNKYGEEKFKIMVEDIVKNNFKLNLFYDDYNLDSAIMFGKNINTAYEILESNDKRRDKFGFEILSFDNTFYNIHYLTMDDNGLKQLEIITQRDWLKKLRSIVFPEKMIVSDSYYFECDAVDDKKHVLMFFDGNIGRLRRFRELQYDVGIDNMEVLCFDFQEDVVKKYIEGVSTKVMDIDIVHQLFTQNFSDEVYELVQ